MRKNPKKVKTNESLLVKIRLETPVEDELEEEERG